MGLFGKWCWWWQKKPPNAPVRGTEDKARARARKRKRKIALLQKMLAQEQEKLQKAEEKIEVARETVKAQIDKIYLLEEQLKDLREKLGHLHANGHRCMSCEEKVGRCVICTDEVAVYFNNSCNHLFLCENCHPEHHQRLVDCPICRNQGGTLTRMFWG